MSPFRVESAVLLAALITAPVPVLAQRLNDTGQTTCYTATATTGTVAPATPDPETTGFNEQDCTRGAAAADALGRMVKIGGSTAPGRDYTKIANDGSELPATAAFGTGPGDWGCTRDNVTGLIWEVKTTSGLRSQSHSYTWYDTNGAVNGGNAGTIGTSITCGGSLPNCNTTAYRNAVNSRSGAARMCGATDWRLPTVHELSSLISSFGIDSAWFPNSVPASQWSSTSRAIDAADAWYVAFDTDEVAGISKASSMRVRLVRGGQ